MSLRAQQQDTFALSLVDLLSCMLGGASFLFMVFGGQLMGGRAGGASADDVLGAANRGVPAPLYVTARIAADSQLPELQVSIRSGPWSGDVLKAEVLRGGVTLAKDVRGEQGSERYFDVTNIQNLPLSIRIWGGTGDADLHVGCGTTQRGRRAAEKHAITTTNNDSIVLAAAATRPCWILIYAYKSFEGVHLEASGILGQDTIVDLEAVIQPSRVRQRLAICLSGPGVDVREYLKQADGRVHVGSKSWTWQADQHAWKHNSRNNCAELSLTLAFILNK